MPHPQTLNPTIQHHTEAFANGTSLKKVMADFGERETEGLEREMRSWLARGAMEGTTASQVSSLKP